jgi:subtilisin family serine protease
VAKDAQIVAVKVVRCTSPEVTQKEFMSALDWIYQDHLDQQVPSVVSMSLYFSHSQQIDNAVRKLVNGGMFVAASAGNSGENACGYSPAEVAGQGLMIVGATTREDRVWDASNYGTCVEIYAPGAGVGAAHYAGDMYWDCNPGRSGTSTSAPLVAGYAAVLLQYNIGASPSYLASLIVDNSTKNALASGHALAHNQLLQAVTPWSSCDYTVPGPPVR